jgi:hypothetical protein
MGNTRQSAIVMASSRRIRRDELKDELKWKKKGSEVLPLFFIRRGDGNLISGRTCHDHGHSVGARVKLRAKRSGKAKAAARANV